jgi:diaminohydroxyphosphoribosylaminopyrimidine deaminase/5-amino-6-(5-phosphoribosylamino)uracil reductase
MVEIENRIQKNEALTDDMAMKLAMQESRLGLGFVNPNPAVGCVILNSKNHFLAKGHHKVFGGPHAEIIALENLPTDKPKEELLKGARLFVTLEPCAHEGKTPSCAKALAKLPFAEIVYGLIDPNPLVAGKGAEIISQAGIKCTHFGKWQDNLEETCEHFLMNFRHKRPFVSLKVASSLDGQMALKTGESKWITGEEARIHGRLLRATHDMTIVGKNTIMIDDPHLNIRHDDFPEKENKLLILDPAGETLSKPGLKIFEIHRPENLFIAVSEETFADENIQNSARGLATLISVKLQPDWNYNLDQMLGKLWDLDIRSVLVEGGALALSSFISQGKAHRLYLFQAFLILGASTGKSWSEQVKIESMTERISLRNPKVKRFNQDLLITGRIN